MSEIRSRLTPRRPRLSLTAILSRRRQTLRWVSLVAATWCLAACELPAETWDPHGTEAVPVHQRSTLIAPASTSAAPATLRVMAWNIKYGAARIDFWFDLWGDRVQMTRQEVDVNMGNIYRLINEVNPDILMTEEIEINSRRSAYTNMVTGILEGTSLNYAAYFPTWRSKYIPSEGLGRMDLGNAIFSRYPIKSAQRISQIDRTDQDPLTRYFYIHRAVGRVVLDVGRDVAAMVVHTEAYDKDGTKGKQLVQILDLLNAETLPFVIGGDFNALPPNTVKLADFNDLSPREKGTDFEQPPYPPDEMVPFYDAFVPHITSARYGTTYEAQRDYFTHSIIGRDKIGSQGEPGFWTRQLDFFFLRAPDAWVPGSTDNLQLPGRGAAAGIGVGGAGIASDPMELSDHCPIVGTWMLAP
jgi:endonuclease/exonuclease/phosphatase family metal-dependent hydrolase